jgi:hypothetical protein
VAGPVEDPALGGSIFKDFGGKDYERFWSIGVAIIYDFRLLIAD